jgi:hypothetical protein
MCSFPDLAVYCEEFSLATTRRFVSAKSHATDIRAKSNHPGKRPPSSREIGCQPSAEGLAVGRHAV